MKYLRRAAHHIPPWPVQLFSRHPPFTFRGRIYDFGAHSLRPLHALTLNNSLCGRRLSPYPLPSGTPRAPFPMQFTSALGKTFRMPRMTTNRQLYARQLFAYVTGGVPPRGDNLSIKYFYRRIAPILATEALNPHKVKPTSVSL